MPAKHEYQLFKLAAVALLVPVFASCDSQPAVSVSARTPANATTNGPVCDELYTNEIASLPLAITGAEALRIRGLLATSGRLARTSTQLERELIAACAELGLAAGADEGALKADPDRGRGAAKVCSAAATKAADMIRHVQEFGVKLTIEFKPPRCFVDLRAAHTCLEQCGSLPTPLDERNACKASEVAGRCIGRCQGVCTQPPGPGTGSCVGTCSGSCDHDFRGTCDGGCEGTCNGNPTHGRSRCVGICDGSCERGQGVCAGVCAGNCSSLWEARDPTTCTGECDGGCTGGTFVPSVCAGDFAPRGVEAMCQAHCASIGAETARCEAPPVRIVAKDGHQTPDMQKFFVHLQAVLPKILRLQHGAGKNLIHAMDATTSGIVEWSNTYPTAGAKALTCARVGIDAMKEAQAAIDASLKGSAGVQTAVKAQAIKTARPDE